MAGRGITGVSLHDAVSDCGSRSPCLRWTIMPQRHQSSTTGANSRQTTSTSLPAALLYNTVVVRIPQSLGQHHSNCPSSTEADTKRRDSLSQQRLTTDIEWLFVILSCQYSKPWY